MQNIIESLQHYRQRPVLTIAATQLDLEILPPLYELLRQQPRRERLDVLFYSRGGIVNAARRVALLLREFADEISFLVPHYCESAGTVTALSANEIIAGPLAIFSPIDPLLTAGQPGEAGPLALSAQDLRLFSEMSRQWFGLEQHEAQQHALQTLATNIFPSTLTSFYRSTLEMQSICRELLALHRPDEVERCKQIADQLIFGYHSHTYALTRDDMKALGLPVTSDPEIEPLLWSVAQALHESVGAISRRESDSGWQDALLGSGEGRWLRTRSEDMPPHWQFARWS
ncbi:serine dehydrogenase proteinase [Permianibacter aggregans]|uniref:Serine dehydrogenase proteinase n=2 Tax=Permianibacter aggregans TaxID=1510150 RepID=A0A4V3D725_9GAMM|nr:serine dehydrogenase proteinase [Permianibacter aggregans]